MPNPASGGKAGFGRLAEAAVLHRHRAAAEAGDVGIMSDDHHGSAIITRGFHENAHDLAAGGLVERAGRLVGEDDRRLYGKRAGDGDALHLPSRSSHSIAASVAER